jgi:hypothetical protein
MMKIEQKAQFKPITITLETLDEAKAIWDAVNEGRASTGNSRSFHVCVELSNWFSNNAQLGG